jgi:hypothetical protein
MVDMPSTLWVDLMTADTADATVPGEHSQRIYGFNESASD